MGWSEKYKKSIDCNNPKGFSQRAHCQGRKKKMDEAKEKDHEVSMAKTQVKKSIGNLQKVARVLAKKTDADNLPAWVQAKLTDTEHNTDAAASYMEEGKRDGKSAKDKDYSLHDWFKGGGWVQTGGKYDGKPCAKQPGQKTKPFCRDADDRAAMSKKERNKRAKKKRKEDPNPNKKGKAKMVTASFSNWRQELQLDELKCWKNYKRKKGSIPGEKGSCVKEEIVDEGKKDACYNKVKSRYKIWPSAYASGALVKCRKVGAANWGNSTNENYEYSNWRDDFQPTEYETTDIIKPEPIKIVKEEYSNWREELTEAKVDKSKMKCNSPKAQAVGDSLTGKSHVVKACEGGKEKIIRFGQRGVKGSPKKKGESKAYASRRHRFQTRHAKNIAKGKMSAAYWANRVKW